jgi:hypothetical protein
MAPTNYQGSAGIVNYIVVDATVYRGLKRVKVPKEVAAVTVPEFNRQQWVLEPPYEWSTLPEEIKKENEQLKLRVMHGWSEGDVAYDRLGSILKRVTAPYSHVFANGETLCRIVANAIGRPVQNIATLVGNIVFGLKIRAIDHYAYEFASTCMRHPKDMRNHCAKARCTYLTTIVRQHLAAIVAGHARVQNVEPDSVTREEEAAEEEEEEEVDGGVDNAECSLVGGVEIEKCWEEDHANIKDECVTDGC